MNTQEYLSVIENIKSEITATQYRAAVHVNADMLLLYYDIGCVINEHKSWGSKFIDNLAADIRIAFPESKGYSVRNLKYMAKFAETYSDREFVQQVVAQIPWGHNIVLMDKVADLKDEGMGIDELKDWVIENRLKVNHWFFTTDLTFFIKGGRVSKVSGFVGNLLNICPLLNVNFEGKLIPREKIRTKKKVIAATVDKMINNAENGLDYDGKCYISMSACRKDAEAVAKLIEEKFPKLNGRVEINNIGTTIGSHTGPGTVALFF